MCGFVVVVAAHHRIVEAQVLAASDSLEHRGPDAAGIERIAGGEHLEAWFAHRRLSIVDVSQAGHQPMVREGRGAIVFNGEIYDHRALRPSLTDRWTFQSASDTEVLLAGVLEDGPAFFARANAMMAVVVHDERRKQLIVARDRLGKKPLYVYRRDGVIALASELKAFHALGLTLTLDPMGMAYYRWLNYIPGAHTVYRECTKFPAGSWATIDLAAREPELTPPWLFWDPFAALGRPSRLSYRNAQEELGALIDDATALRLEADAPVAIFLSGGIDSALVASSARHLPPGQITTFVVRPDSPAHDESSHAASTARALGLTHTTLDLPRALYPEQIEKVAFHFDDPCAPLSQLALMALAHRASSTVKVVLTGDGGDEVFLGYPWFGHSERIWRWLAPGRHVRGAAPAGLALLDSPMGRALARLSVRGMGLSSDNLDQKLAVIERATRAAHPISIHEEFLTVVPRGELEREDRRLLGDETLIDRARAWYPGYSWDALEERTIPEALAALDLVLDMRDHILVKVDRATMAYGIEARSPLLDHRIVEFGLSLPLAYKRGAGGRTKRILRDLCAARVGAAVATRPKSGFGISLPDSMPEGPNIAARWNRFFESRWRETWGEAAL